jgi:hypothetical protein
MNEAMYLKQRVTRRKMGNQWPKIRLQRNFFEMSEKGNLARAQLLDWVYLISLS